MLFIQNKRALAAVILGTLLAKAPFSVAQPDKSDHHQGPPPEAIAACAELESGASCSFTGRQSEAVQGSCKSPPKTKGELACAPEGGPRARADRED